jgi:hypothetical protein
MGAVPPFYTGLIDQPEPCFVHQSCRLKCVAGAFLAKLAAREQAQLIVNQGKKLVRRNGIAISSGQ